MAPRKKTPPLTRLTALFLVAALVLFASCNNDDSSPDPPPTTQSPESEVKADYLAYWEMLERLSASPDDEDQEIAQRASGRALEEVVAGLRRLEEEGRAAHTGPLYGHRVLSVTEAGGEAKVRDCAVDDSVIVDRTSGGTVAGGEAATGLLEASLVNESDGWKVERIDTLKTWPGAVQCDEN